MMRWAARALLITLAVAYLLVRYAIRQYVRKELSWPRLLRL
jgi:hypothetical protein